MKCVEGQRTAVTPDLILDFNRGPLPFDRLMVLSEHKCVEGR